MTEWVLIFTMSIAGQMGEIRDVSPALLGGFTSKQLCDAAAEKIAGRTVALVGQARMQQGIVGNSNVSTPRIWTECVPIQK